MKFRGNYTIAGKMESTDVVSPKGQIEDFKVGKAFSLIKGATVNMAASPVKNVGTPVDKTDAATKDYIDGSLQTITVMNVAPDFSNTTIPGKANDLILIGNAPGPIACSDPKVANKPVSDLDCSGIDNNVYAIVQDPSNSLISSQDGGKTWSYVAALPATTDPANNFFYITTLSSGTMVAWRKKMSPTSQCYKSSDGGKTWTSIYTSGDDKIPATASWLPARVAKPTGGPLFLVNTDANNSTRFIYSWSPAFGGTQMSLDQPSFRPTSSAVSAASNGERLIVITSAGETVIREKVSDWRQGGTLPQLGVVWNDIVSIDKDTWVACSGRGSSKSYAAVSTDFGASWKAVQVSGTNISLTGIQYNSSSNMVVVTGDNASYVSFDKGETWHGTVGYSIPSSQSVTAVGAGFIAASTTANFEILYDGDTWSNFVEGIYSDMYFKATTGTGWSKYVPNFNGESYLLKSGGEMLGDIRFSGGAKITGLPQPTSPNDVTTKSYVDGLVGNIPRRGTLTAKTAFTNMVQISQEVETVKLTIVAKGADTAKPGRYYSEMVIVIDPQNIVGGKVQPESTEYAVISTGDLQVTASIPAVAAGADISVSFTANRSCNLEVIVETIDLEADGKVTIQGESGGDPQLGDVPR